VEEVIVEIPFSRAVRTTNLKVTAGTVLFDEATKVIIVIIRYLDK
jgi:hypothetical protein